MADTPKKMSLTNIDTGEGFQLLYNPEEVNVDQAADWTEHAVPVLSFQPTSFAHTKNVQWSADIVVDGTAMAAVATNFMKNFEAFLFSLLHPPDEGDTLVAAAPPRVLVFWPGWLALQCKARKITEKAKRFRPPPADPAPDYAVFSVDFFESRRIEIGSQSVRIVGLNRG